MSASPVWKFPPVRIEYPLNDPVQDEFFTTDSIGGLSEALVREVVQNSIDARAAGSTGPVQVRFEFSGGAPADAGDVSQYYAGLEPHLRAKGNGLRNLPRMDKIVPFLTIEDFGTTGLCGDVTEIDIDEEDGRKHDFYWFWRNVGRSGKSKEDLGRWGLGKAVFPALSQINTFFGLSVSTDNIRSLMGQCTLKIHRDRPNIEKCSPYGYWGEFDPSAGGGFFSLPVQDPERIRRFCVRHRLRRCDEPGFSIVIPFPDIELAPDQTLSAIVRQWFYPIVTGLLEITVTARGEDRTLNAETVREIVEHRLASVPSGRGNLLGLLKFATDAVALPESAITEVAARQSGAPAWREVAISDDRREKLRLSFDKGDMLAFKVSLNVQENGGAPTPSHFDVFMAKDPGLERCEDSFVRAGISVSAVHTRLSRGLRALVVVDDPPLRKLLGDAENPAHTEWQKESRKFKGKYSFGPSIIDFVKGSVRALADLLTPTPVELSRTLLDDVFFVEEDLGAEEEEETPVRPGRGRVIVDPPPKSPRKPYSITQAADGFKVQGNAAVEGTPSRLAMRVAYRVRRGNPFTRYSEFDFNVADDPINMVVKGAEVTLRSRNEFRLRVEDPGFSLTVTGFDRTRDLRVSVTEMAGDE